MFPERPAAADLVLPHAGLRFVDAERDGFTGRQAELIRRQSLLVQTVSRLVQDAEEGVAEVMEIVARRDALVARPGAGAEGMVGDVESTGVVIEPDRRRRRFAKSFLSVDGKLALEELAVRLP